MLINVILLTAGYTNVLVKHTRTAMIEFARKRGCCVYICANKFSVTESKNMRMRYWQKSPSERHQWLLDKFSEQDFSKKHSLLRTEKGISVCVQGFLLLYGINRTIFYAIRRSFLRGKIFSDGVRLRSRSLAYLNALNWMETYASYHGDRMPTCSTVYLPYRTKKINVYRRYTEEVHGQKLKQAAFYQMWTTSFTSLKIKEVSLSSSHNLITLYDRFTWYSNTMQKWIVCAIINKTGASYIHVYFISFFTAYSYTLN